MRFLCSIALLLVLPSFLAAEIPIKVDAQRLNSGLLAEVPKNSLPQPLTSWRMVRDSALIFSGTVLRVEHFRAGPSNAPGSVFEFRTQFAAHAPGRRFKYGNGMVCGMPVNIINAERTSCFSCIPGASWGLQARSVVPTGASAWTKVDG